MQTNTATNVATYSNQTNGTHGDPLKVEILEALRRFARQRPGLDFRNYGDVAAYREDMRGITRDLKEAQKLLRAVELSHGITGRDLIDATKRGFSGRLSIEQTPDGPRINYCTGQYFPTEYRRAVASVCASALWDYVRDHAMPAPSYGVEWKNERGEYIRTDKTYRDPKEAEAYAAEFRVIKEKERAAFDTPPHGYGYVGVVEIYKGMSGGDWLRRYFRREFGRGIASRWFN